MHAYKHKNNIYINFDYLSEISLINKSFFKRGGGIHYLVRVKLNISGANTISGSSRFIYKIFKISKFLFSFIFDRKNYLMINFVYNFVYNLIF